MEGTQEKWFILSNVDNYFFIKYHNCLWGKFENIKNNNNVKIVFKANDMVNLN